MHTLELDPATKSAPARFLVSLTGRAGMVTVGIVVGWEDGRVPG